MSAMLAYPSTGLRRKPQKRSGARFLKEGAASRAVISLGTKSALSQQPDLKQYRHEYRIASTLQDAQSVEQRIKNHWTRIMLGSNRSHEIDQARTARHEREVFAKL